MKTTTKVLAIALFTTFAAACSTRNENSTTGIEAADSGQSVALGKVI